MRHFPNTCVIWAFHHHSKDRFSAGVPQQDATVFAQFGLVKRCAFVQVNQLFERRFGGDLNIEEHLGELLVGGSQL